MVARYTVETDPELMQLAIALRLSVAYRLWLLMQEVNRRGDGSGRLSKILLRHTLGSSIVFPGTIKHTGTQSRASASGWNITVTLVF